jgi:hypothetical protein
MVRNDKEENKTDKAKWAQGQAHKTPTTHTYAGIFLFFR